MTRTGEELYAYVKDAVEQTLVNNASGEEAAEREEERAQQSEQRVGDREADIDVHVEGNLQLLLVASSSSQRSQR